MVQTEKKRNLLFINQYYAPDRASTGQLLTELCEGLTRDFDVTALVGTPSYSVTGSDKDHAPLSDVTVKRVFNTSFSRKNIAGRLLNYLSFMVSASLKSLFLKRPDLVITMSDPPTVNFIGYMLKKLRGVPHIQICQDVYPELALALSQADNPLLISIFSFLNSKAQFSADGIVAISDGMKKRLSDKGIPPEKINVIENWIDTDLVTPQPKKNPFSEQLGITDKFTVMHSGNVGLSQNLTLLLEAAEKLKDKKDVAFIIIGDGAEKENLTKIASQKKLYNVLFAPYQKKEEIKYSLSSGDVHFVSLKRGLSGLIVPSKVYGIMAAGRPVISVLEEGDNILTMMLSVGFGENVESEDPGLLAKRILDFYDRKGLLVDFGDRARDFVEKKNSKALILKLYGDYFRSIIEKTG